MGIQGYMDKKLIAILGFDAGGREHALKLMEQGYEVVIGLKEGDPNWIVANNEGFKVYNLWDAASQADIVQVWY